LVPLALKKLNLIKEVYSTLQRALPPIFSSSRLQATWRDQSTSNNMQFATDSMISKCANPQCAKTLMRMDGGRFFGFHTKTQDTKSTTLENFWLCSNCSRIYTLRQIEGRVELLSRERKSA
jgi:hypothetical protein